jgi:hypothetical protein
MMYSAATVAFGWPTSFALRKRGVGRIQEKHEQLHAPKEKLSIEVADVDCIHIDHMYILET